MDRVTDRVLGLDSGGTKTIAAVVSRSGAVACVERAAGLDPTAGDDWVERLTGLLAPLPKVGAAVLGLPFHGEMPAVSVRQTAVAQALLGPAALVMNDVAVAFEAALAGEDGVLILAGTGAMAWARGPKGAARSGGWGDAFGDEGSAYWIGREALALVSMHLDGRKSCASFAKGVLEGLGIEPEDLMTWTYGQSNPRARIASVAPHVTRLAALGDPESRELMGRAAAHLVALGQAAARACGAKAPLRWSYAGGVLNDPGLRQTVTDQMGIAPIAPRLPPVGGAVLVAAKLAGWNVDDAFIDRLNAGLTLQIPTHPQEVTQ